MGVLILIGVISLAIVFIGVLLIAFVTNKKAVKSVADSIESKGRLSVSPLSESPMTKYGQEVYLQHTVFPDPEDVIKKCREEVEVDTLRSFTKANPGATVADYIAITNRFEPEPVKLYDARYTSCTYRSLCKNFKYKTTDHYVGGRNLMDAISYYGITFLDKYTDPRARFGWEVYALHGTFNGEEITEIL